MLEKITLLLLQNYSLIILLQTIHMSTLSLASSKYPFTSLSESQKQQLFGRPHYPTYQLTKLYARQDLMCHQKFAFFMQLVKQWNADVKEQKDCSIMGPIRFKKIQFIYSSLEKMVFLSQRVAMINLQKLHSWFESITFKEPLFYINRSIKKQAVDEQQWQIRNTYKSNMPLSINTYERHICFQPPVIPEPPQLEPTKTHFQRRFRSENKKLLQFKENKQISDCLKLMKKNKAVFGQRFTSNFNKPQFRNHRVLKKIVSTKLPEVQEQQDIKDVKAQTMMSWKSSGTWMNAKQMRSTCYSRKATESLIPLDIPDSKNDDLMSVDGLGLINNPFEIKTKSKKR